MKSNAFRMCMLYDFYGELLTDKQKDLFTLYYDQDLSLTEISEEVGITRQGVRDAIIRSEEFLLDTEDKLRFVSKYGALPEKLSRLNELIEEVRQLSIHESSAALIDTKLDSMTRIISEMND